MDYISVDRTQEYWVYWLQGMMVRVLGSSYIPIIPLLRVGRPPSVFHVVSCQVMLPL